MALHNPGCSRDLVNWLEPRGVLHGLDHLHDVRQAGGVGEFELLQLGGSEPSKLVVLVRCGIYRLPIPTVDHECVHLDRGVCERHRNWSRVTNADAEFFTAFSNHSLLSGLSRFDMSTDQVPAVGVPATLWVPVGHQYTSIAHQRRSGDGDAGRHSSIVLSAVSDFLPVKLAPHNRGVVVV